MNQYFYENFEITELSYFEYKNLVKNLFTEDLFVLNQIFEKLIDRSVKGDKDIDILNKIKILLFLRSLTLGEEIKLNIKDKNHFFDINSIIKNITVNHEDVITDKIILKKPNNLYTKNILDEVINSIQKIIIKDKEIDFFNLTNNQKNIIFNEITDTNILDIVSNIIKNSEKDNLKLIDLNLNLHNGDILIFLKSIFLTDLNSLYDFEYFLIRELKLNSNDFQNYSFSELKILFNKLTDEFKDNKNASGINPK
jgi:hypothetical protein